MNRADVRALQSVSGYPAVSILMPTHRTAPDNQQDPIRAKNLVSDAEQRLLQEFSKREIAPVMEKLEALVDEADWQHALDGLAIYANPEVEAKLYVPFPIRERVVIDETFATRDLVFAMNRSPRYWVLMLGEQPTRLFEAAHSTLEESRLHGFPIDHSGPGGATALPGGHGISRSARRDQAQRDFFRQVDEALTKVLADDPLPVILAGIERNTVFFREVTQNTSSLAGEVYGSFARTSPHELGALTWPQMQEALALRRAERLEQLERAVSQQRYASGLDDCWRAAVEGRADVVIVEEDFHYPAVLSDDGMSLTPAEDATAPGVIDDAVDELIEQVIAKGGEARFVEDGVLASHNRIAMITRY
jgi:hypothetical protein